MTGAIERRGSPRHPAVRNKAVVEFRRGGRPRWVGASLVNISSTGALLRMAEALGLDQTLWIHLIHPVPTPVVLATVVRIGEEGEVGIEFAHACNRTFFWSATRGEDFHSDSRVGMAEAATSR